MPLKDQHYLFGSGRPVDEARCCLLDQTMIALPDNLFPNGESPISKRISVNGNDPH